MSDRWGPLYLCVRVRLSVYAYPGIYTASDIRPRWWRVSSSSSLAQTPALMSLPSAGWTLSHSSPLCAALFRHCTSLPIVSCSQIKQELISQLAQLVGAAVSALSASSLKPSQPAGRLSITAKAAWNCRLLPAIQTFQITPLSTERSRPYAAITTPILPETDNSSILE